MTEIRNQVKEFHDAMKLSSSDKPLKLSRDRLKLRLKLITEEYFETLTAATGYKFLQEKKDVIFKIDASLNDLTFDAFNVEEFADGLGDLDYVVEGTRVEMGIDGGPIAEEIHAANMRKVGGPIRSDGKQMKPIGWVGPNIKKRLEEQGWKFNDDK